MPECYKKDGGSPHEGPHGEDKAQHQYFYGENNQLLKHRDVVVEFLSQEVFKLPLDRVLDNLI